MGTRVQRHDTAAEQDLADRHRRHASGVVEVG